MSTTTDSQSESNTRPQVDYTQEVRFAIVMYGGLSLAIYINGVAQELLHLLRSTAPQVRPDESGTYAVARYADEELTGSEQVYRKLADPGQGTHTARSSERKYRENKESRHSDAVHRGHSLRKFGGGINAVFLAKALLFF